MSKHHQSHRRRSYGRRQHELHERPLSNAASTQVDLDATGRRRARAVGHSRYDLEQAGQPLSFSVGD